MKRFLVLVGITFLVLVWSSSSLIAGSPATQDRPAIITPQSENIDGNGLPFRSGATGGDEGDADDLAGAKGGFFPKGTTDLDGGIGSKARMLWRAWLVYLLVHKL